VVRNDDARHARDARGEDAERPNVHDVHEPRPQRAELAHEVAQQHGSCSLRERAQLGVVSEPGELGRLWVDDDGRLVEPFEDLLEV
jgi:hypothetical protein